MYSKSATTIANILEAARKLFVSKNYSDVTMVDIASAAQVTKGALYHHFESKEALYLAMLHADLAEKRELLQRAADTPGTCRDRLRRLTLSFLEMSYEKQELMKLVRRDINVFRNPTRDRLVRAYQAALPQLIEEIIQDGMRNGELQASDPRLLAWEYVAMVEVVLSRYARKILGEPSQMADYVLGLFMCGSGVNDTE